MSRHKDKITLRHLSGEVDDWSEPESAYVDYAERWATVRDATGSEAALGQEMQATISAAVEMRYPRSGRFPCSTDQVQVREQGRLRTLEIVGLQRIDTNQRQLKLLCKEVI